MRSSWWASRWNLFSSQATWRLSTRGCRTCANKDYIFVQGDDENGEFKATIKRLVRHDAKAWTVKQFNEPREFTLEKRLWTKALRVMGRLSNG